MHGIIHHEFRIVVYHAYSVVAPFAQFDGNIIIVDIDVVWKDVVGEYVNVHRFARDGDGRVVDCLDADRLPLR